MKVSLKHLKEQAITLRKGGKSYGQILRALGLKSKGTLSSWFKNLKLSPRSQKLLEENNKLARKRNLHKFNTDRANRIATENKEAHKEGLEEISSISKRELLLISAALYWGEGSKHKSYNGDVVFTNSDPAMIAVFLRFLREVWNIEESRIRAGIHIYPTIDAEEAKKYWANVTKLPRERFYIVNQVSRASQGKRPFNTLPYGTAVIQISARRLFFRMKGMIQGIASSLEIPKTPLLNGNFVS